MNDPNGLVYENGRYHLFYQYYPDDVIWGPMHWGHAISRDLIHWEHLPIALFPDKNGMAFSGSAVRTDDGCQPDPEGNHLVLMYTSHGSFEQQSIAFSEAFTAEKPPVKFVPFEFNPVIRNDHLRDFRDPKVFENGWFGGWNAVMAAGDHAVFMGSQNMINWSGKKDFGPFEEFDGCIWECPSPRASTLLSHKARPARSPIAADAARKPFVPAGLRRSADADLLVTDVALLCHPACNGCG